MPKTSKAVAVDKSAQFKKLCEKFNKLRTSAKPGFLIDEAAIELWTAECKKADALLKEFDDLFDYDGARKPWYTLGNYNWYFGGKHSRRDILLQFPHRKVVMLPTMMCNKEKKTVGKVIDPASRAQRTDVPWHQIIDGARGVPFIDMPNNPNFKVDESKSTKDRVIPREDDAAADARYEDNKIKQQAEYCGADGKDLPHVIIYDGTKNGQKVYAPWINGIVQRMCVGTCN